jgi:pimeloyl-ACP methyl ester carboxylesterase
MRVVGELAGQAMAGTGTLVRDVHAAIARRAFEAVGPQGAPARLMHDGVSAAVLVLIGHSMGGLVARSACHCGGGWTDAVRHVVCLGSPHRAAPLAKGATLLGWTLQQAPETRPFARVVDGRSAGIKDLRHGVDVPFPPHATLSFVAATLSGREGDPLGDLLVRYPSAAGAGSDGRHLGGLHHFDLLNHPAVNAQLRDWLA